MMKKGTIVLIAIAAIVVLVIGYGVTKRNSFVSMREGINHKASDIDVNLERRTDLIPNLINTVKGYMKHEQSIIDSVTSARTQLINAKSMEDKSNANKALDTAINNLLVVVENYPDLKANQNFISLQDELAGTENRLAIARKDYNNAVSKYNSAIQMFPGSIIASLSKMEKVAYFEVSEGKSDVPQVNFE